MQGEWTEVPMVILGRRSGRAENVVDRRRETKGCRPEGLLVEALTNLVEVSLTR